MLFGGIPFPFFISSLCFLLYFPYHILILFRSPLIINEKGRSGFRNHKYSVEIVSFLELIYRLIIVEDKTFLVKSID